MGPAHPERSRGSGAVEGRSRAPIILLSVLILAYASFFSAYTLQRHATLNTTAADVSPIDQAMWNTLHGRLLEQTIGTAQAPRFARHLELILLPLSLTYLVWDDVAALLIIQSLALAIGALPVFWIARRIFAPRTFAPSTFSGVAGQAGAGDPLRAGWLALAFALAYLLNPALQAANVAGFHAETLAIAPLLFAFWYGTQQRWRPMWGWALLAMATREDIALLTAMLGLLLMLGEGRSGGKRQGLALLLVSLGWYATVTFFVVAPFRQAYGGTAQTPWPGSSLADLAALWGPAWLDTLAGLLRSVGWLALLAPELLLLGLPFLMSHAAASTGPHGEMWQAAALLVPTFIVAAIYGARRLQRFLERQASFRLTPLATNATVISVLGAIWLLVWAGAYQIERGWTPLARPFEWPVLTDHARTLARLTSQIPAGAAVSATTAVHPHLSHRHEIYVYPEVAGATHVLIDVTAANDLNALETKLLVDRLIRDRGFGVVDAADGYLLLAQGAASTALPDDFYSFTRAGGRRPEVPVDAQLGPGLRLLGFDVLDDVRWRQTHFRFYWQIVEAALPSDLAIKYEARTPAGVLVDSSEQRPLPALVWRSPEQWEAGEVVVTETIPWFLPRAFAPALQVTGDGQVVRPDLSTSSTAAAASAAGVEVAGDGTLRLPGLARREGRLGLYEGPLTSIEKADVRFADADWTVRLAEWSAPLSAAPGGELTTLFYWQAEGAAPQDYAVSLHLADVTGKVVASVVGQPTWFTPRPATAWEVGGDGVAGVIAALTLSVPENIQPGRYDLVVGWMDQRTGARLNPVTAAGNPEDDAAVLGPVTIDPLAGSRPDACCLAAEPCCTSME